MARHHTTRRLLLVLVMASSYCRLTMSQPNMRYPPLDNPGIKKQGQ